VAGCQQYTVTSAPQLIIAAPAGATIAPVGWFYVANGAAAVYLGGDGTVSSTTGALVAINGTFTGFLFPGDQIWAYSAGSSTVTVLQTGA
jgi:hypothetical protein